MTNAEPEQPELWPDEAKPNQRYVQVALNVPLRREFTYVLPVGMDAFPGNRVRANFHGRKPGGDRAVGLMVSSDGISWNNYDEASGPLIDTATAGGRAMLLTSDIEAVSERALLERHGGRLGPAVMTAPHHGSRTSSAPATSRALVKTAFPVTCKNPACAGNCVGWRWSLPSAACNTTARLPVRICWPQ